MELELENILNSYLNKEVINQTCPKERQVFNRINRQFEDYFKRKDDYSLHTYLTIITGIVEKYNINIPLKHEDLLTELYSKVMGIQSGKHIKSFNIVWKAHYLTLVYYKLVNEKVGKEQEYSHQVDLFIKSMLIYIKLNTSFQINRMNQHQNIEYYDFIFEFRPHEKYIKIIEQLNTMYIYCEYLKNLNHQAGKAFKDIIGQFIRKLYVIVETHKIPIRFEKYKTIRAHFELSFSDKGMMFNNIDDYLYVLLYAHKSKSRYICRRNFTSYNTSEERKTLFLKLFKKAEELCLHYTSGKSAGLFGPILEGRLSYDKNMSEFHFNFVVSIDSRMPSHLYYVRNYSRIIINYKYTKVNIATALKILKKLKDETNLVEREARSNELFRLTSWFPNYMLNSVPTDIFKSSVSNECSINDYYYVDESSVSEVCDVFNACEEILQYKRMFKYQVLLEIDNTFISPQEKGTYFDADYDSIWGKNHKAWKDVIDTDYQWEFDL